ncbi:MAG: hypothetical protein GY822_20770 [Deltaproteobacteria bacterium]|nr:hypothetical protein [Deltaproteobacteria bacterium]
MTTVTGCKETEYLGMSDGKSERLHSTCEAGELTQWTQWRDGERRVKEPREGKAAIQQRSAGASTGLSRVARLASTRPEMVFTTLAHHIDMDALHAAHSRIRKTGAVGQRQL